MIIWTIPKTWKGWIGLIALNIIVNFVYYWFVG